MDEVKRLQKHLNVFRNAIGWSQYELAEKSGLNQAEIVHLEMGSEIMDHKQYVAIRKAMQKESRSAYTLLEVFVDHPEKYDDKKRESVLRKLEQEPLARDVQLLVASMLSPLGIMAATGAGWFLKSRFGKKK